MKTESFVVASILGGYPDESYLLCLSQLLENHEVEEALREVDPSLWQEIRAKLQSSEISALAGEYIDLFDRGKSENSVYETEYGRERALMKGVDLADIAGFYRAFGFEIDRDRRFKEMVDHIAVELEFYALLKMKKAILVDQANSEGTEIVADAMKKFLNSHLGRFAPAIVKRPAVEAHPYYSRVFAFIAKLVQKECEELNVKPTSLEWISGQVQPEAVSCAVRC